jgi:hypothetical protein
MLSYLILGIVIAIILTITKIIISADKRREKRAAKCAEMNTSLAINNLANDALAKLIK